MASGERGRATEAGAARLSARDDADGAPVDWWFIYKLPEGVGEPPGQGYDYLYYDAGVGELARSAKRLNSAAQDSALEATLCSIFDPREGSASWILYDDEHPSKARDSGAKGHCKGVLAFDRASDSGVLLIHSTPRFPKRGETTLPEDERIYGQTYLCITLKDYATANAVAEQLRLQQDPQVYDHELAAGLGDDESVSRLARGDNDPPPDRPQTIDIQSEAGFAFKLIAKNRRWGGDFWIDLVAPTLGVDMKVESWRRGTVPPEQETKDPDEVEDVIYMDLAPLGYEGTRWKYTKDHAKWGVSEERESPWVCVGDLNRMVSQEKRGGGTAAFLDANLWKALDSIERLQSQRPKQRPK